MDDDRWTDGSMDGDAYVGWWTTIMTGKHHDDDYGC